MPEIILNGVFMAKFTSPLNNLKVASPCSQDWEAMLGNERKRFCGECKLNVYNLSGMTTPWEKVSTVTLVSTPARNILESPPMKLFIPPPSVNARL